MSTQGYVGRQHNGRVLTGIVAGHAVLLGALMLIKMDVITKLPIGSLVTENIPLDRPPPVPPPPPEPKAQPRTAQTRSDVTTIKPPIPVPSDGPVVEPAPFADVRPIPGPIGEVDVIVPPLVPIPAPPAEILPPPTPRATPIAVRPRGDPGGWVTNEDYPASALRSEEQGRTVFRLTVGVNGRPTACAITSSSGSGALDGAACRLLMRRARFVAGSDADGKAVGGTYANSFRWEIPAD